MCEMGSQVIEMSQRVGKEFEHQTQMQGSRGSFLLSLAQQNGRFELPVTTTFQSYKPFLHAGSWLESTLVQNNKIKDEILFSLPAQHWQIRLKGLI